MREIQGTNFRTPIEIALDISEDGMTTAKKLYEFLELRQGDYSRWIKNNITENEFAEENTDYWVIRNNAENPLGGRPTQDFKLTAHFAKKLSCKGNGVKAEEAREYFTTLEERVKQKLIDRSKLSPQMQMFYALADNQAQIELEQKRLSEQQKKLEQKVQQQEETIQTVRETFVKKNEDTAQWITSCLNRIAESPNFHFNFGNRYSAAKNESYERLSKKAGCRLDQKLRNAVERAKMRGCTRQQINGINKLSVIMADKRLREIYMGIVKEMTLAYCMDSLEGGVE